MNEKQQARSKTKNLASTKFHKSEPLKYQSWYTGRCTGIYVYTGILVSTGMYGYLLVHVRIRTCTYEYQYVRSPVCTITYRYALVSCPSMSTAQKLLGGRQTTAVGDEAGSKWAARADPRQALNAHSSSACIYLHRQCRRLHATNMSGSTSLFDGEYQSMSCCV